MRSLPAGLLDTMLGSSYNARLQFNAWYQGTLTYADLPVTTCSYTQDAASPVQTAMTFTVKDRTGTLTPWSIEDTLGVGGARIGLVLVAGSMSLPLGMLPVTTAEPDETWTIAGGNFTWVQNSAEIVVEAKDTMIMVGGDEFMAAEGVPSGATCVSEIRRLLTRIMDVVVDSSVTDIPVPSTVIYGTSRQAAVADLVTALGASYRQNGTGQFYVYVPSTTSQWSISGGVEGSFINLKRTMRIEDFPNAVVSTNTAPGGVPLYGVATQGAGPGYFDGPHGRWVTRHNANLATTQAAINADAATMLATVQKQRTVEIPLSVVFHPGIEIGDYVTVNCPVVSGSTVPVTGQVRRISWTAADAAPATMDMVISCAAASVQTVSTAIRKAAQWGQK